MPEILSYQVEHYRKEGKNALSLILAFQYPQLNKIIEEIALKNLPLFVYDDFSPETKMIKRILHEKKIEPVYFAKHFYKENCLMVSERGIDFHSKLRDKYFVKKLNKNEGKSEKPLELSKNSSMVLKIAIDSPPDALLSGEQGFFRNRYMMVKEILSFLGNKKHEEILILPPDSIVSPYLSDSKQYQWGTYFKKRAKYAKNERELTSDYIVLTWSTERYFYYKNKGIKSIPLTKSLAPTFFINKNESLSDIIAKSFLFDDSFLISTIDNFLTFPGSIHTEKFVKRILLNRK